MWQGSLLDEAVQVDDLAALPLAEFARGTRIVEFQASFAPGTMFLVPHARFIPDLVARGIPRGRIWLADEVRDLLAAQVSREDLVKIVESKLLLDGFIRHARKDERRVA